MTFTCYEFIGCILFRAVAVKVGPTAVADPGNWKGGFQTIERKARGVKSARSAKILGLRPLPVQ